ncbi:linoleoyl-CoA desaturase [Raineyella antarctica]|uniref:Linoleoyl-CoA desaturase n=1 Tax=Raineyella antarctica TaxID=1577474 RepID=A0A1G6GYG5_9ACTN|nr:acyl-CoA desaturase [Raineyella antarctica]SDB87001.1 linoleoyl-CoA desaturase [Raineyella antarctica]
MSQRSTTTARPVALPNIPALPEERHLASTSRPDPIAHLSTEDIEQIGRELDAMRDEVLSTRGARDAAYVRRIIRTQRILEMSSRTVLLASRYWPAWVVGTAGLSASKILENMELGHNTLHGQWDWMRDPKIHSTTWQWDMASPPAQWQRSHNAGHHKYTNIIGLDEDLGYGLIRVDPNQPWKLSHVFGPVLNMFNAALFQYGIAAYDLDIEGYQNGKRDKKAFRADLSALLTRVRKNATRDYVLYPLLSGPSALPTLAANATANLVRNLWAHSVIFCGHFPSGIQTFEADSIDDETRGEWYVRQMLGSGNISGSPLLHLMTGNLSFQIEHHLFPDLPSNRYSELAPRVQELMERYGLTYVTGPLPKQVASAWAKIFRYSLPNADGEETRVKQLRDALADQLRGIGDKVRERAGARTPSLGALTA